MQSIKRQPSHQPTIIIVTIHNNNNNNMASSSSSSSSAIVVVHNTGGSTWMVMLMLLLAVVVVAAGAGAAAAAAGATPLDASAFASASAFAVPPPPAVVVVVQQQVECCFTTTTTGSYCRRKRRRSNSSISSSSSTSNFNGNDYHPPRLRQQLPPQIPAAVVAPPPFSATATGGGTVGIDAAATTLSTAAVQRRRRRRRRARRKTTRRSMLSSTSSSTIIIEEEEEETEAEAEADAEAEGNTKVCTRSSSKEEFGVGRQTQRPTPKRRRNEPFFLGRRQLLVHWKGERNDGYSIKFRQLEFENALWAELKQLKQQKPTSQQQQQQQQQQDEPVLILDESSSLLKFKYDNALEYHIDVEHDDSSNNDKENNGKENSVDPPPPQRQEQNGEVDEDESSNGVSYQTHLNSVLSIEQFNEGMQYVTLTMEFDNECHDDYQNHPLLTLVDPIDNIKQAIVRAVERCSLIHSVYEVMSQVVDDDDDDDSSDSDDDDEDKNVRQQKQKQLDLDLDLLARRAIDDGGFSDMYHLKNDAEENDDTDDNSVEQFFDTWCFRARSYRNPLLKMQQTQQQQSQQRSNKAKRNDKGKRYGSRARSMKLERDGLKALRPLLEKFGGQVDLNNPQMKIYIMDGLVPPLTTTPNGQQQQQQRVVDGNVGGGMETKNNPPPHRKATLLVRQIARGPRTSIISPASRICVTTTPLEEIAAFCLVNVAQVQPNQRILDPYSGSCTTFLAAAMIVENQQQQQLENNNNDKKKKLQQNDDDSVAIDTRQPLLEMVGIEVANDWYVNRTNIMKDFESRGFTQTKPTKLIQGDCTSLQIRKEALDALQENNRNDDNQAKDDHPPLSFDVIITDPPYGIREKVESSSVVSDIDPNSTNADNCGPLDDLFHTIASDRRTGRPLLKPDGGRLVAFVPVTEDQTIRRVLPSPELCEDAGLHLVCSKEQKLNEKLSRWLVAFESTIK